MSMAQNSTYAQMISCADSPLSITGNIIGILTLAYAIVITLLYYCYQLSKSTSDLRCYIDSFRDELNSLESALDRLIPFIDRLPKHLAKTVSSDVATVNILYKESNNDLEFLRGHGSSSSWSQLVRGGLFIAKKNELAERQGKATQMRIKLDGIYNVVIQSIILDEIKLLNQRQSELFHFQRAFLEKAIEGIRLPCPGITTESEETQSFLNNPNTFDILNEYLRPQTQWDPPGLRESHICSNVGKAEGSTDITPSRN